MGSNPVTYIVSPGDDVSGVFIYASNEPKSVLARDLGDCRDNLRNSQSVFLIVMGLPDEGIMNSSKIRKITGLRK